MRYWVSTWKLDQIMQYVSKQKTKSEKTPTDLLYWYNFFSHFNEATGNANV